MISKSILSLACVIGVILPQQTLATALETKSRQASHMLDATSQAKLTTHEAELLPTKPPPENTSEPLISQSSATRAHKLDRKRVLRPGGDGSCSPALTNVPADNELLFTYIINAGPVTFTLPLIDNDDCDLHLELYDTVEPNDYQSTVPMTFVDLVSINPDPDKPLLFGVTAAGYITMDLTDTNLHGTTLTMLGKAVSDDPEAEEPAQTFIFTIKIYDRPCNPNLNMSFNNEIEYHVGEPAFVLEFSGITNGNCDFTVIMSDKNLSPPEPIDFAAATIVQATFQEIAQDPWMSPHYKEIVTYASLSVYTTDVALIGYTEFKLWMVFEDRDKNNNIKIDIRPAIVQWRNLPINNDVYDTTYRIGSPEATITFNQDLTNTKYSVEFYDTTAGTSLPSTTLTSYSAKQPVFSANTAPPADATKYQKLSFWSNDFSLIGQPQTVVVVLQDLNLYQMETFSFEVTYTFSPCTPNPQMRATLGQTYTYYIGMPTMQITAEESNGDCPFYATFTLASELTLTPISQAHISSSESEIKLPVSPTLNYEKKQGAVLSVYTNDLTASQTIPVKFRLYQYGNQMEVSVDLTVDIVLGSCNCGFQGLPSTTQVFNYEIDSGNQEIDLTGLTNTECGFQIQIYDTTAGTALPNGIFTITQPTVSTTPDYTTGLSCFANLLIQPKIEIDTSDWTLEQTTLDVLMVVNSDTVPSDTASTSVLLMQVTFVPPPCTPTFVQPTLNAQYMYKIGAGALTISFSGADNGDCNFSQTVRYVDTNTPDPLIFTITGPILTNAYPTGPSSIFSLSTDGSMTVQTSSLHDEKIYSFEYIMADLSGTYPDAILTFDVQIWDNLCVKAFRGVPLANAFDRVYAIGQGTKQILLTGLDNTECEFSIELYSDAALTSPLDTSTYTVVDPILSGTTVSSEAKVCINSVDIALAGTSVDVFVKVNSDKNAIDNDETSFVFSVNFVLTTCSTSLTTTFSFATSYDYKITDSALNINFGGITNNNCKFTATLIDTNTLLAPPFWMSLTQPTFSLTAQPDLYAVATSTVLAIQTNTLTDKGTFDLRLTLSDEFSSSTSTFDFTVRVFNNPCQKGLNNVPTDNQFDSTVTLGLTATDLSFTESDNTECEFGLELYYDASLSIPVEPSSTSDHVAQALSVVAPTFTPAAGATYPEILTVTASPILRIQSTTWSLQDQATVTIYVKFISMQDAIDTDFASFSIDLNFITVPCSPNLQNSISWPSLIEYKIEAPALSMTAAGLNNNDCAFVSALIESTGAAFNPAFQWQTEVFTTVTAPNVFSLNTPALLTISSTDIMAEGFYSLRVEQTDIWGSKPQYFDFQVRLYINQCQPAFLGLPGANEILDHEYLIRVANVAESYSFESINNSECTYSVEIYDSIEGQTLPASFSLTQPTFAPDPSASDPEIQMQTTPAIITVQTNEVTLNGQTIPVLVVLRSTRYSQDTYTEQFLMNVKMTLSCDPLFADQSLEPIPKLTSTYQINKDTTLDIVIASSNLLFNPTCQSPYQTSFLLSNSDGSAADASIFSLAYVWTENGMQATVTVFSEDKNQAGLYSLQLLEKDTAESDAKFETIIDVTLVDFCSTAKIELGETSSVIDYVSESGPQAIDMIQTEKNFAIDLDHREACSPLKFSYQKLGGADFDPAWVAIDSLSSSVQIEVGLLTQEVEFAIIISGSIKGEIDYARADHQVNVIVTLPEKIQEEEQTEQADQADQDDNQVLDNILKLTEQKQEQTSEKQLENALNWSAQLQEGKNEKADPPLLDIFEVTKSGLMTISFSKPMIVPSWDLLVLGEYSSDKERMKAFQIQEFLTLHIESDQYTSEDIEIAIDSYTLVDYEKNQMQIQIYFASPNDITKDAGSPDEIFVTVKSNPFFIDKEDLLLIPLEYQVKEDLPSQLTLAQEQERVELEEQLDQTMQAVSWANLAVNLVFAYGIKYLWNAINLLQMAVYFPLWKLNYSQNAISFLKFFKMIVLMEFLPTHLITEPLAELFGIVVNEDQEEKEVCDELDLDCLGQDTSTKGMRRLLKDELEDAERHSQDLEESFHGYSKKKKPNIIQSIGIIVFLVVVLSVALALVMMMRCCIYSNYKCFTIYMNIKQKVFYNAFIRFAIQGALKLQIGACLTLVVIDWSETSQLGQGMFAIALILSFVAVPILFIYTMWKHRENLNTLSTRNSIGTLYHGIDTESNFALSYTIVFLARRSLFCIFTFAMFEIPGIQVQFFIFSSVIYMIYLNQCAFYLTKLMHFQENLNEYMFILICYHLVLFGNLIEDFEALTLIGSSLAASCALMLGINLVIIMVVNAGQGRQKCRRSYLVRQQAKEIKRRELAKQEKVAKQQQLLVEAEMQAKKAVMQQKLESFSQSSSGSGSLQESSLKLKSISSSSMSESKSYSKSSFSSSGDSDDSQPAETQPIQLQPQNIQFLQQPPYRTGFVHYDLQNQSTNQKLMSLPKKKRNLSQIDDTVLKQTKTMLVAPNFDQMLKDVQIINIKPSERFRQEQEQERIRREGNHNYQNNYAPQRLISQTNLPQYQKQQYTYPMVSREDQFKFL